MAERVSRRPRSRPISRACRRRSSGAGEAGAGVEDHGRAVHAPGVGGERGDAARSRARRDARRARAAALFPDQQGPVVAPRSQRGRSCRVRRPSPRARISTRPARPRRRSSAGSRRCPRRSARAPTGSSPWFGARARAFTLVPYNVEYQNELAQAAALLREAAVLTSEPTLKAYLTKRADAFLSNDYYDSDVAWMDLKGAIEPTIGPYEVYEDEWFNAKAAFESFITVQDEAESAKLQKFAGELQDIEDHLPIDPKYRNPKLGTLGADRRRQRDLRRRRREPRRADGRVQPAERRARRQRKGQQARHAEERPGREVRQDARADLEGRARRRRSEGPFVRRVLHPHPRPRADARAGAAQHHGRRTEDDGPAGAEGNLQRDRRGEGGHLEPLRDSVHDRQGRAAEVARSVRCTRRSSRRRSGRSGSASTRRTDGASPFS